MIQFLLKLFNSLRRIALDFLNKDRWFIVLDPSAQETPNYPYCAEEVKQAVDARARDYERSNQKFTKTLSLNEAWAILNPLSIVQFLRYSLSDVV